MERRGIRILLYVECMSNKGAAAIFIWFSKHVLTRSVSRFDTQLRRLSCEIVSEIFQIEFV
jgi:hypothetical protein